MSVDDAAKIGNAMRIYQLVLRGGLTRNIEAAGYKRGKRGLVFVMDDGGALRFKLDEVIMIEEIRDEVSPAMESRSDRWGHPYFTARFA